MNFEQMMAWLRIGQRVFEAGRPAIDAILQVLATHGIEGENVLLDTAAADAVRRKALAERDASPATPAPNGVHSNSPGD
jgi:hypothetical protein